MNTVVEKFVGASFRYAKELLRSSRLAKNLIADRHNSGLFTNLRAHEVMLSDRVRVEAYREGLRRNITPGSVVVDLGTGSGILSLLAAAQRPRIIYAIDHSNFIEIARTIAGRNAGVPIEFVHANSRTFNPPEPVDFIVHEQLGTGLFDENLLTNLLDLKARILKPGGKILPGRFDVFIEPAVLKPEYVVPHIADIQLEGIDLSFLRDVSTLEPYRLADYHLNPHDARVAVSHFLGRAEPCFTVDLNAAGSIDLPSSVSVQREVTESGPLDAYCMYFRAAFDEKTAFDTSPLSRYTHWGNWLFRADSRPCRVGGQLSYRVDIAPLTDARQWRVNTSGLESLDGSTD